MSSSAPYEGKLCCAICGDAILPPTPEPSEATRWQTEAVLLSDPDREFEHLQEHYRGGKRGDAPRLDFQTAQDIQKVHARVLERDRLRIISSDESAQDEGQGDVLANHSYGRDESGEWAPTPYYIAIHGACLEVAEAAMRRSPHGIAVRDMRTLWKVLRMRFEVDDAFYMSTAAGVVVQPQRIPLSHGYYMPFRPLRTATELSQNGESGLVTGSESKTERWEAAYPLLIPDATAVILENLKTLPPPTKPTPQTTAFQRRFMGLPLELRDHVCSFMASRHGMPGLCNGLLPQWVWREMLLTGECLPFLPRLDEVAVEDFCSRWGHGHGNQEPNWELLVRLLSQEGWSIWDAERSSLKVPNGLRNRRRIWQLVEEMYVGDILSMTRVTQVGTGSVLVPRYWDHGGELLYPVTRVKTGSRN
ncbi:hypothetical protein GGR54DRAFT_221410 [Hypoxylon sp. NC1633]|nr:hypothetical protein GGR54DRAFT_221410 [Hypoxylon sp. NC1633]